LQEAYEQFQRSGSAHGERMLVVVEALADACENLGERDQAERWRNELSRLRTPRQSATKPAASGSTPDG